MISQSAYQVLCECVNFAIEDDFLNASLSLPSSNPKLTDELQQFAKPYVLVIHKPSGRGFYLNRQYHHIVDVSNCQEPENPTEVSRDQLPGCGDLPSWVCQELSCTDDYRCYDSFWLY